VHQTIPETRANTPSQLTRDIGLHEATSLNMIDMIGVGPFVTIPLIVGAMGGPQAMLGWILGAFFAICDGQVWAELGASMPKAGGSYQYLKETYGQRTLGRLMSFLFVWQLTFSAPLSIASGCLGVSQYATFLWKGLAHVHFDHLFSPVIPLLGKFQLRITISNATFVAIGCCALAIFLLYRKIGVIGRLSKVLWVGVIVTMLWVIFAGLTHFSAARAFSFPQGAFAPTWKFFTGLGSAMLFGFYDYWGYYNVCFLGAEVRSPEKNIPKAVIYSIMIVGALYLVMNISILGVLPWQEMKQAASANNQVYVAAILMQRVYGEWAGRVVSVLIIWTAFASVFSLILGYSRVPYAAAVDNNYFRPFAKVHPEHRFPHVSLLIIGSLAAAFCIFRLADVVAALVVIRISTQFVLQILGLLMLRLRRPDFPRPFRMWLYPAPAILALVGYLYVLRMREEWMREVQYAVAIVVVGLLIFLIRSWRRKEWPFSTPTAHKVMGEPV
jgi:amino acid transporter